MVVVGGGPAGLAAAIAAARNGARVTLLERYNHLGGLASGGMVLVLDDMWDSHLHEISVRGICMEMIERMAALGLAAFPQPGRMGPAAGVGATLDALGRVRLPQQGEAASDLLRRRLRSGRLEARRARDGGSRPASSCACIRGSRARWSKDGRRSRAWSARPRAAARRSSASVVIDATGDLDVAASAGAPHIGGGYIVTTVFRLGGVDTDAAERFERRGARGLRAARPRGQAPASAAAWEYWWLKTPLPGVVWCNCPHMAGLDGLKVEDLTRAEVRGPQAHPRAASTSCARTCPASSTAT